MLLQLKPVFRAEMIIEDREAVGTVGDLKQTRALALRWVVGVGVGFIFALE